MGVSTNATRSHLFQSRNRDAFRFKVAFPLLVIHSHRSFNLGIEMLFVSRGTTNIESVSGFLEFQSRNRDAFRFKLKNMTIHTQTNSDCFNLGIEMLFVSSYDFVHWGCNLACRSFNLGIEMLFVSSRLKRWDVPGYGVSISESRCFSFQGWNP